MRTSEFQFSNPTLSELQFYISDTYNPDTDEINVNLAINVAKKRTGEKEATVELTIEIGEKNEKAPFYVKAVEGAAFRWEEGAFEEEEDVEKFLSINAPALLISYLRPIVSNVTMFSKYPAYNIPFINFNDVQKNS